METGTSITELLSFLAILVASLSALYARWAWSEAHKANELTLHQHRKEIYDSFFSLKSHMTQHWDGADISEVAKFFYSSKNATFYFDEEIASEICCYYKACFYIADNNRPSRVASERIELIEKAKEADKLATALDKKLIKLITVA
ncbi:hypothetical protein Q2Y28_004230 [Vibrio vulnificus]|uniref:hypothetical protein n=1 Tax=Vibrio vulnificus TaxID=672 RepID=UPI001A2A5DDE|nr:hypothetical protein [Vibrio vulnificus]EGR0102235.1 hypothetical protein [Vibrio vulnificus]EIV8497523.1 hypothetical protein [Vibrio vulnificus]ELM6618654.1 hypothetical protein [Vibrio vulnificus]MCG6312949.1 hypothetical protein [Vibrio vulnificus]MDS1828909.1 hypothetical protein [Vibrio vulnificus]